MENKYQQALQVIDLITNSSESEYLKSLLNLSNLKIETLKERVNLSHNIGIELGDGNNSYRIIHHPVQVFISKYVAEHPIFDAKLDLKDGDWFAHFWFPSGAYEFDNKFNCRGCAENTFKGMISELKDLIQPDLFVDERNHFFFGLDKVPLVKENLKGVFEKYNTLAHQELKNLKVSELETLMQKVKSTD